MRTTLDIDEDVLAAAKELAAHRRTTTGKMLSELARRGLRPSEVRPAVRNGVPLLPPWTDERPVSTESVEQLLDEE